MKTRYTIDFPKVPHLIMRTLDLCIPVKVTQNSVMPLKKQVEICARYFMREGYSDFLHYDSMDKEDDAVCFLFMDHTMQVYHALGAACFRHRQYSNVAEPIWAMHWAWIHPFERNKGLLTMHKEYFDMLFGYWYPEYPLSKAMEAFVKKNKMEKPKVIIT